MSTDVEMPENGRVSKQAFYLSFRTPLVGCSDSCLAVADLWSMAFDGSTFNRKHDVDPRPHMASSTLPNKGMDMIAGA